MRTLLIDNHDSYTYNLYQLIALTSGRLPTVVVNDDLRWDQLDLDEFDAAVISPGPGNPNREKDFGHSWAAIRRTGLPVLGVCLGHQGIGAHFGSRVEAAPKVRHGHISLVDHCEEDLFEGIPNPFRAVRYHSLHLPEPLPGDLRTLATSEDDVVMALRHRTLPRWGVQFHPESVSTEHGRELVSNFLRLARESASESIEVTAVATVDEALPAPPVLHAQWTVLEHAADTALVARAVFAHHDRMFWLDSARVIDGMSRFSFLGAALGAEGETLTYNIGEGCVRVHRHNGVDDTDRTRTEPGSIFDALRRRLDTDVLGADALPFDLTGGYVGYFGYELKSECGMHHRRDAATPDAVWIRADHLVVVDHVEERTYVLALTGKAHAAGAQEWIDRTVATVRSLVGQAHTIDSGRAPSHASDLLAADLAAVEEYARPRAEYLAAIDAVYQRLLAGDSYEVCLTNMLHLPIPDRAGEGDTDDELDDYLRLRTANPAPYAAFLRSGELAVHCSSPERFLRVDRARVVESKPIKGTAPRAEDPAEDERLRAALQSDAKTQAENLMIVDLLRNDLGRVCQIGSVSVPSYMATETYSTVHQLVSTVRGELAENVSVLDCVRACFPGGSMTGAPKLRTTDIIDDLETEARGVYSGTLGYLGFNGAADLNIVIRTAVQWRGTLSIGAGGALVVDSDPKAEYEEMLLKALALVRVFAGDRVAATSGASHG